MQYKDVIYDKTSYKNIFKLLQSSSLILYGTGGSGKTTFAKVLVGEGRKKKYFQKTTCITATEGLQEALNDNYIASLQSYNTGSNLLIIDDLQPQDKQILGQLCEILPTWKIVVTTRGQFELRGFATSKYETDEKRGKAIFWRYYFGEKPTKFFAVKEWLAEKKWFNPLPVSMQELSAFCKEIANHSLTLELVATLLKNDKRLSLALIREKMQTTELDDEQIATLIETGYLRDKTEKGKISAFKCLLIAFENAQKLQEKERILLQNLCLLPTKSWEKQQWLFLWENKTEWINAENQLIEYGWLQNATVQPKWWEFYKKPSPETYQLHSLVREMLFYEFKSPTQYWDYTTCQNLLTYLYEQSTKNPNSPTESYLRESITQLLKLSTENNEDWASFLLWEIGKFYSTQKPTQAGIATALKSYEKAAIIYEKNEDKYNLATSYSKLGDIHSSLGNLNKALVYHTDCNTLIKKLHNDFPNDTDYMGDLAVSYVKLGETHSTLGNLDKALAYFEKDLELSTELYAIDANNLSFKRHLAISYFKLGEIHTQFGNLKKALEFFAEMNNLLTALCATDPADVEFKTNLAASYEKLGSTHSSLGNLEKSLEFFKEMNKLFQVLYANYFHTNVKFKNGLAISYGKLGENHTLLGNLEEALVYFEKYNQLEQELYADYPNNLSFKYILAISYQHLGLTYGSLGNLDKALEFYEEMINLSKELYAIEPTNVSFKDALAISYIKLGDFYINSDRQKAKNYYLESKKLLVELVQQTPDYVEFQKNLKWVESKLAGL